MKIFTSLALFLLLTLSITSFAQENAAYEKAYQSYELGEIDESYIHLKNSLSQTPDHLPSKILMGEVLALSAIYEDARAVLEEAMAEGADVNLVLDTYVKILLVQRDYNTLIDLSFEQLTSAKQALLFSSQATALKLKGNTDKAAKLHEQATKIAPRQTNILNAAAYFWMQENNIVKSKALLDQSMLVNADIAETQLLLGNYFDMKGDQQSRLDALQTAISLSPDHPIVLRDLVTTYVAQKDYSRAKSAINKTLSMSPNDPMAQLLLSWVETKLGNTEAAKQNLDELVSALSLLDDNDLEDNAGLLMVSALANLSANNLEVARGQLEQYLSRQPGNFKIVQLLADVYKREANYIAASNLLEKHINVVQKDINLVADLCEVYINADQNFKCNGLLQRTRSTFGQTDVFIRVETSLLAARGKLELALENLNNIKNVNVSTIAQKAVVAINANKLDAAAAQITELLSIDPNNNDFINLQASMFKKQRRFDQAESLYRTILNKNTEHYAANFNLASLLYNNDKLNESERIINKLLETRPTNQELLILLGRILTKKGDTERALEVLTNASILKRNNVEAIEALMFLHINLQDFDSAMVSVTQLLKDNSTQPEYLKIRSSLHYKLGNYDQAKQDLRIVHGIFANNPAELYMLSIDQSAIKDEEGALRSLLQSDKLAPNNFFVERDAAKLAMAIGNIDVAQQKVTRLNNALPNNPDVLLLQGDLHLILDKKLKAAQFYNRAVNVANNSVPALIGSYKLAMLNINTAEFESTFTRLALSPKINVFAVHLLADYYFTKQNFERAKELYISISDALGYPPLPIILNNLASVYLEENKVDAAYNFAQQAHEAMPSNPNILDTLGWILTQQGKYNEGLDLLRKSYSMNTQNPNLRYHLAYTLHKLGRIGESKRELKLLLQDFPSFSKRNDAVELMDTLNKS